MFYNFFTKISITFAKKITIANLFTSDAFTKAILNNNNNNNNNN